MATQFTLTRPSGLIHDLNTRWHRTALLVFAAIVVVHWFEHVFQAWQIWVMDYPRPQARGMLGQVFPWLVSSEWLHFGYAVIMVAGLALLLPGFVGRGRKVWAVALAIQVWHLFEHALLFYQGQTHTYLAGRSVPTSILQLVYPGARPEIHIFYNAAVTIPMIIALYYHSYPPRRERETLHAGCTCARV